MELVRVREGRRERGIEGRREARGGEQREYIYTSVSCTLLFTLSVNTQARFPDGQRLLFPVKSSQVREVGLAEAKLDTSVVLSHGIWTGTLYYNHV